ncbi:magnesium-transporting ATPase (P-type) [Sphingomonas sp. F9_3S_D5_B_2]
MSDRGVGRARLFVGTFLLTAAIITWATGVLMSPHGETTSHSGVEHVRTVIVVYLRNTAIGTLVLTALSGWLLFPARRPKKPVRDWLLIGVLAVLAATSLYQLYWLQTSVHN